jgi:hypothetical protein
MSIQTYLMPQEEIRFSGPLVTYSGTSYDTFVTSARLVLLRSTGVFFKDYFVISERLDSIKHIRYSEEGIFFKDASIVCVAEGRELAIAGPADQLRGFYASLLQATGRA